MVSLPRLLEAGRWRLSEMLALTTNGDTAEWLAMFDDVLPAQSAVDCFRTSAYDFVVEGESYRSRLKPKIEEGDSPPKAPAIKVPALRRRSKRRR